MFIWVSSMASWSVLWTCGTLEIQHLSPALFNLGVTCVQTNSVFTQLSYWGNMDSHSKTEYCSHVFAQLMSNVEGNWKLIKTDFCMVSFFIRTIFFLYLVQPEFLLASNFINNLLNNYYFLFTEYSIRNFKSTVWKACEKISQCWSLLEIVHWARGF